MPDTSRRSSASPGPGLLVHLATPASSTELATRLAVAATAVNQRLRTLHAAGLLVSARHGRLVPYRRCDLGDHLAGRYDSVNGAGQTVV